MEPCTIILIILAAALIISLMFAGVFTGACMADLNTELAKIKAERQSFLVEIQRCCMYEATVEDKFEEIDKDSRGLEQMLSHYISIASSLAQRLDKLEGLGSEDPGENK